MVSLTRGRTKTMEGQPERKGSKRGRVGEGRPTKRTPEVVAKIGEAVSIGLTDEEAALLAGVNPDTMTEWRKDPEFSGAIKRAGAQRIDPSAPEAYRGRRAGVARHSLGIRTPAPGTVCTARGHESDRRGKPGRQGFCRKGDCSTGGGFRRSH